jgi:hypothetical protein
MPHNPADTEFHELESEKIRLHLIRCREAILLLDEEGYISSTTRTKLLKEVNQRAEEDGVDPKRLLSDDSK